MKNNLPLSSIVTKCNFKRLLRLNNMYGSAGLGFVFLILIVIAVMTLLPVELPGPVPEGCRVGKAVDPLQEPSVWLPPIKNVGKARDSFDGGPDTSQPNVEYVLIRKYVPIFTHTTDPNYAIGYPDYMGRDGAHPNIRWPVIADVDYLGRHADTRHTVIYREANQSGFDVYYANSSGEVELPFLTKDRTGSTITITNPNQSILTLRTEGFLLFVHLGDDGEPIHINYGQHIYYLVDFYQDKRLYETPVEEKGYTVDDMFHCLDPDAPAKSNMVFPDQKKSDDKLQLQLQWFVLEGAAGMYSHCKPAVYLYPERKKLVNIKVFPKGDLTYTDPKYDDSSGWTVHANPDGKLTTITGQTIPANYLYYESKLLDKYIQKPEKGWVVQKFELENLFNRVLPKLGLNQKEESDFKAYWLSKLPDSPYYFVGLVEKSQRDFLEPLSVTPNPDTSIRFSFYFEPLEIPMAVEEPEIQTPERNGFTLVDWGGMIKLHKDTPFTCSQ
jgi:hypothetical protein